MMGRLIFRWIGTVSSTTRNLDATAAFVVGLKSFRFIFCPGSSCDVGTLVTFSILSQPDVFRFADHSLGICGARTTLTCCEKYAVEWSAFSIR
eukprot:maker-scaffold_24-snap-gene-1.25-mRNA-1 protein AED:0.00 eAED:0.00 QI:880/1/1/1/1/1/2/141/92